MSISDADLLDSVRKMRKIMHNMDNSHVTLGKISSIEDHLVAQSILAVMPDILSVSNKLYSTLKAIENSVLYKDMIKKFNLKDDDNEQHDN